MRRVSTGAIVAPIVGIVVASMLSVSAQQRLAITTPTWTGSVRCEIDITGPGYVSHQTHTWTLTGALASDGNPLDYPATWSVSGAGSLQPASAQASAATWKIQGAAPGVRMAIFVRQSDQRLLVFLRNTQLNVPDGTILVRQPSARVTSRGQLRSQQVSPATEWRPFPTIVDVPTSTHITGSSKTPITDRLDATQPLGSQGQATCTWDLVQGSGGAASGAKVVSGGAGSAGDAASPPEVASGAQASGAAASSATGAGGAAPAGGTAGDSARTATAATADAAGAAGGAAGGQAGAAGGAAGSIVGPPASGGTTTRTRERALPPGAAQAFADAAAAAAAEAAATTCKPSGTEPCVTLIGPAAVAVGTTGTYALQFKNVGATRHTINNPDGTVVTIDTSVQASFRFDVDGNQPQSLTQVVPATTGGSPSLSRNYAFPTPGAHTVNAVGSVTHTMLTTRQTPRLDPTGKVVGTDTTQTHTTAMNYMSVRRAVTVTAP